MLRSFLRSKIRKKLSGYNIVINQPDLNKPRCVASPERVAVVGGGLAGIGAASLLGERGFKVTLFERNHYLGGKAGCWDVPFEDGNVTKVDHGFHAFFRHYYNLRSFMEKNGAAEHLKSIADYLVVAKDRRHFSYKDIETTPVLNILSLGRNKFFRFNTY